MCACMSAGQRRSGQGPGKPLSPACELAGEFHSGPEGAGAAEAHGGAREASWGAMRKVRESLAGGTEHA